LKAQRKDTLAQNESALQALKIEKETLSLIEHPFIIKIERIFVSEHRVYQLMPLCEGRDFSFYMQIEKRIKE
jgi:hypothetical protein